MVAARKPAKRLRSEPISFMVTPEAREQWRLVIAYHKQNDSTGARQFENWLAREHGRILRDAQTTPWIRALVREIKKGQG